MKNPNNISPKYTVFTPTYNRKHTIDRVFNSLNSQTMRDFEWVVVDDGSSDGTAELIREWQSLVDFKIVYEYQPNSGKHIAFNRGVDLARGELFLAIDSDDGFLPTSLESMLNWWETIPLDKRQEYTGIVTLAQFEDGSISGKSFPYAPFDTTSLDMNYKLQFQGERWGFHRTSVLKEFPFPQDEKVRFVPENIVWDAIARKYKIRCINEPLRIYYQDSGNQVTKANPKKKAVVKDYFLWMLNRDLDYFKYDPKTFTKFAVLYVRYSLHLADWAFMSPLRFKRLSAFLLCLIAVIPGGGVYLLDLLDSLKSDKGI